MNQQREIRFLQGNEAVVEAAIQAGVRFFAGYPITPASEISEVMSQRLPLVGGTYLQMEDELASMAAIAGASMGGVKAMTATSGPGFSLMQENLGFASMTELPCVVVDVMRVGPASGMPTLPAQGDVMQARWGTHGDHPVVVLCPSTVKETFDLTIEAVNLSERMRVPVILLSDAIVGHIRERIEMPLPGEVQICHRRKTALPPEEYRPYAARADCVPDWADRTPGYRYHMCSNNHGEDGFPVDSNCAVAAQLSDRLRRKMELWQDAATHFQTLMAEDAEIMVVTYGSVTRSAREAVAQARREGVRLGLLQLQTLWPFPAQAVRDLCLGARKVLVPEMNMGQIIGEVERALLRRCVGINRCDGKVITPGQILDRAKEVE